MNRLTGRIFLSGSMPSTTNIAYLSGFTAPDPFLFLQTKQSNYLLLSPMEKGRAEKQSKPGTRVVTAADLGLKGRQSIDRIAQIEALMNQAGIRLLEVPTDFPVGLYQELEEAGVEIKVQRKPLCAEREIKSSAEVARLRESQRSAVAAMKAAIALIGSADIDSDNQLVVDGEILTSERVRQLIHKTLLEQDCIGMETIVAGGDQATDPHERGSGPLYGGEAIILDIFPQHEKSGYWGDITRTVCRGKPSAELKRLYQAVKAAQAAALRAVSPGACASSVHQAAKDVFEERGFETKEVEGRHVGFIHGTGHGVGLEIHELPRVSTVKKALEVGNVITVEPGLYYPGLGGVRIEDTIVVTSKGWRYLAPCEKKFELV